MRSPFGICLHIADWNALDEGLLHTPPFKKWLFIQLFYYYYYWWKAREMRKAKKKELGVNAGVLPWWYCFYSSPRKLHPAAHGWKHFSLSREIDGSSSGGWWRRRNLIFSVYSKEETFLKSDQSSCVNESLSDLSFFLCSRLVNSSESK